MTEQIIKAIVSVGLAIWEYASARTDAARKAAREKADLAVKQCFEFIDNDLLDHNATVDKAVTDKFGEGEG